ncbi:M48 family metallopeptidase [Shewanella zhangzhouensis]|uniref:M48 family metallopeptidase n=1 Tax=Shewanella zhangzhouensis TaxID=2864213 RepID=UPI001C6612DB|nr:M48 family metallopeptidase [Shewanella zhangzhouensis]QYK05612.1 M48 family metallopeptidase [Shewanella zhangzhouensis]
MVILIEGHLLAPKQAKKHPAAVRLDDQGFVTLSSDVYQCKSHLEVIGITDAVGNLARNLCFNGGWVFVSSDTAKLNDWIKRHNRPSLVASIERHLSLAILCSAILLFLMWGTYRFGLPLAAKTLAAMMPVSVQEYLGEYSRDSMESLGLGESHLDAKTQAQVQKTFHSLLSQLDSQGYQFHPAPKLYMMGSKLPDGLILNPSSNDVPHPGMINAFALADGSVVLTDAMINLAIDKGELESVILHELGHHHYNHLMTSLIQSTLLSVTVAMIMGDSSGLADIMASSAVLGLTLGYSRHDEREADAFAIKQMQSIYGSTKPLADLYQKLEAQPGMSNIPSWLSTHPDLSERINTIRAQ